MTDTVIIYTQDDCPPCAFIKNYLVNKNIKFAEKNIKNQKKQNNHDNLPHPRKGSRRLVSSIITLSIITSKKLLH